MIERMIQKGVEPDPITFGTVIHFATIHQDTQLVSDLISRARQAKNGQLTLKSVQALIRACLEMKDAPQSSLSANLERALEIIQSLTQSKFICSPNTGKYCIAASLKVQNPGLAFKFWTLLVRKKLEWTDPHHSNLRVQIAIQIRKHLREGWLSSDLAMAMLHTLGMGPKIQ
jgi:hypothetical protein